MQPNRVWMNESVACRWITEWQGSEMFIKTKRYKCSSITEVEADVFLNLSDQHSESHQFTNKCRANHAGDPQFITRTLWFISISDYLGFYATENKNWSFTTSVWEVVTSLVEMCSCMNGANVCNVGCASPFSPFLDRSNLITAGRVKGTLWLGSHLHVQVGSQIDNGNASRKKEEKYFIKKGLMLIQGVFLSYMKSKCSIWKMETQRLNKLWHSKH